MEKSELCYRRLWSAALERYLKAEAEFAPVHVAFDSAEHAWFAAHPARQQMARRSLRRFRNRIGLDKAYEDECRYGNVRDDALSALINTPACDLATVISKLELIIETHFEENVVNLLLSDLKRVSGAAAAQGRVMP